jgi:hypothetical protein
MSERKTRVWLTSVAFGAAVSVILTGTMLKMGIAYWFPPFWPGLFLWIASAIAGHGLYLTGPGGLALVTTGNAAFYAWGFSRILRAEILARGNLSRYFLR